MSCVVACMFEQFLRLKKLCSATPLTNNLPGSIFRRLTSTGRLVPGRGRSTVWAKKNSSDSQKSFEYDEFISSSLDLTYLSRYSTGWSWHLTFIVFCTNRQVVKASAGHFPQPFLIRDVLRTATKICTLFSYFQIPRCFFSNNL